MDLQDTDRLKFLIFQLKQMLHMLQAQTPSNLEIIMIRWQAFKNMYYLDQIKVQVSQTLAQLNSPEFKPITKQERQIFENADQIRMVA